MTVRTDQIHASAPLLELDRVTVTRGHHTILDQMTLTIPSGQHTVILGPNGSGKTSLLKVLISQFYPSVEDDHIGVVRIFGQSSWNVAELRQRLGIVSGELDGEFAGPRAGRMTGLEAVLSGLDGVRLVSYIASHDRHSVNRAREALSRCNALPLEHQTLATMSTGERRRVLIARALVHQPVALILDEPTTGLDIAARYRFLELIQRLGVEGTVIVLVTHHVEEIVPPISHCVFLKRGKVFDEGPCQRMLQDQSLSMLFDLPVKLQPTTDGRYGLGY